MHKYGSLNFEEGLFEICWFMFVETYYGSEVLWVELFRRWWQWIPVKEFSDFYNWKLKNDIQNRVKVCSKFVALYFFERTMEVRVYERNELGIDGGEQRSLAMLRVWWRDFWNSKLKNDVENWVKSDIIK